jgi:enoyl-CoA hydratase/carnithine racemase
MIELEHIDGTAVIRLDAGLNTFDAAFLDDLEASLDRVEGFGEVAALVTTGTAKYYSNGFDLEFLGSLEPDAARVFVERTMRVLARVLVAPFPTVAAVNGHAFGVGAMLALVHDQRVMRDDRGWFCLPEVDLGMQFHPFMQSLVTSVLGERTAREAILTGRRYGGGEAQVAGIVDDVATEPALVGRAVELALARSGKRGDTLQALKRGLFTETLAKLPPA